MKPSTAFLPFFLLASTLGVHASPTVPAKGDLTTTFKPGDTGDIRAVPVLPETKLISSMFKAYKTGMPPSWTSMLAAGHTPTALAQALAALPTEHAALVQANFDELKSFASSHATASPAQTGAPAAAAAEIRNPGAASSAANARSVWRGVEVAGVAALGVLAAAVLL